MVLKRTESVFRSLFRPRPRFTPQERDALAMAVHFLDKPLSELKQYVSDNPLIGPNSMRRLREALEKVCANL